MYAQPQVCGKRTRGQWCRQPTSQLKTKKAKLARNQEVEQVTGHDVIGQVLVYFEQHPDQIPELRLRLGLIDVPSSSSSSSSLATPPHPPSHRLRLDPQEQREQLERATSLYHRLGCSDRKWNELRRYAPDRFPSLAKIKQRTAAVVPAVTTATVDDHLFVCCSLSDCIRRDLEANPELAKETDKWMKVGGDGAKDTQEKDIDKAPLTTMCYAWLFEPGSASRDNSATVRPFLSFACIARNCDVRLHVSFSSFFFFSVQCTRILRAAWESESYELLSAMCRSLGEEMEAITRDGIIHENKRYDITWMGCGDMKFTRLLNGLGSASSTYCCSWCNVTLAEMGKSLRKEEW